MMKKIVLAIFLGFFLSASMPLLFPVDQDGQAEEPPLNEVQCRDFGGFRYVYMDFHGPYTLLSENAEVFQREFDKQGIKAAGSLLITFHNPPYKYKGYELRWAVCYPIEKGTKVKKPLKKKKTQKVRATILKYDAPSCKTWESFSKVQEGIYQNKFKKLWIFLDMVQDYIKENKFKNIACL